MHVRISTFEGPPDVLESSIELGRTEVLAACEQLEGFQGLMLLADRQTGKSIALTFWESAEALRRSEEEANRIRQESASQSHERVANVERYELDFDALTTRVRAS